LACRLGVTRRVTNASFATLQADDGRQPAIKRKAAEAESEAEGSVLSSPCQRPAKRAKKPKEVSTWAQLQQLVTRA
jgi:hypothetical protein